MAVNISISRVFHSIRMTGNTPLHLAVMMGHRDCVQVLLSHGAGIKLKNAQGWTPVAEAVSYGDRETSMGIGKTFSHDAAVS